MSTLPRPETAIALQLTGRSFAVRSTSHTVIKFDRVLQRFHCANARGDRSTIDYVDFMSAIDAGIIVFPGVRR